MEMQTAYLELAKKILQESKINNKHLKMVYGTTDATTIESLVSKRLQLNIVAAFNIPLGSIVLRERGTIYEYYETQYFEFYEYEVLINGAVYKQSKSLEINRFINEVCTFYSAEKDVVVAMDTVNNAKGVFDRGCTNRAAKLLQEIVACLCELAPSQLAYTDPRGYNVWVMTQYYNYLRKQVEKNINPNYMKGLESFLIDYQKILSLGQSVPDLYVNLFDPSLGELLEIFDQCSHSQKKSATESLSEAEFGSPIC